MFYYYEPQPTAVLVADAPTQELREGLSREFATLNQLARIRYSFACLRAMMFLRQTFAGARDSCVESVMARVEADLLWGRNKGWICECNVFLPEPRRLLLVVATCFRSDRFQKGSLMLEQRIVRRKEDRYRVWRSNEGREEKGVKKGAVS